MFYYQALEFSTIEGAHVMSFHLKWTQFPATMFIKLGYTYYLFKTLSLTFIGSCTPSKDLLLK